MAYATYADMEAALDQTVIAQLCGDAGTPMPGPNPMVTAALDRATAVIRSYCRVGNIYNELELAALDAANADAGTPIAKAVPLANLNWYNAVSNSGFFPARRGSTYP